MWKVGAAIVAAGLALSCIKPPRAAPGSGDADLAEAGEWRQLKSLHFTLVSDLGETDAARVLAGFEEIYAVLGGVVLPGVELPDFQTTAIVFAKHSDAREFLGDGFGGVYRSWLPNDLEPTPTVIASGTLSPGARMAFAHELAHRFNHAGMGVTPTWLNEGLADFYSTIRGEKGKPVIGEIDPRYMCVPDGLGNLECGQHQTISGNRLPSASQLLAFDADDFYERAEDGQVASFDQKQRRSRNYGSAWLLVHMLMTGKQDYARRFREALAAPPSSNKGAQVADVINRVPTATLDRDLQAYLGVRLSWRQHHAPLPPAPRELASRALTESEALVWLARLHSFEGLQSGRAFARLNRASELFAGESVADSAHESAGEPAFWLGRYNQLRGNVDQAIARYEQAIAVAPDKPEYLYGLLTAHWREAKPSDLEPSSPIAKTIAALTPVASSPQQLNAVAGYQLVTNDVTAALTTSERACRAGPDCWPCFHNRALILFYAGRAADALQVERQAQARLTEHTPPQLVAIVLRALDYYEAAGPKGAWLEGRARPSLLVP